MYSFYRLNVGSGLFMNLIEELLPLNDFGLPGKRSIGSEQILKGCFPNVYGLKPIASFPAGISAISLEYH